MFIKTSLANAIRRMGRCLAAAIAGCLFCTGAQAQFLYDNAQNTRLLNYVFSHGILVQQAPNPAPAGIDTTAQVLAYERSATEPFDVIIADVPGNLADVTPYRNGTRQMRLKFYSAYPGTVVQLTLQHKARSVAAYPLGRHSEYRDTTTLANSWEELEFTYYNTPDATVSPTGLDQVVIQIAPNTLLARTYYFDEFTGPEPEQITPAVYDDFENVRKLNYSFAHGTLNQPVANPNATGVNVTSQVASYVRSATEPFDVIIAQPPTYLSRVLAYRLGLARMRIQVLAPQAGTTVQLTLQSKNISQAPYPTGRHSEYRAVTTTANAWENLEFTYFATPDNTVSPDSINEFVLQFAPGVQQAAQFYFDNLSGPPLALITATRPQQPKEHASVVPNPFITGGHVLLTLTQAASVTLRLTDVRGATQVLPSGALGAGSHRLPLPASLPSGIYAYQVLLDNQAMIGRFVKQ